MLEIIKIIMDEQVFAIYGGTHTGFSIDNVEKIDINAYDGYMP